MALRPDSGKNRRVAYAIERLLALDWDQTVAALQKHGSGFYWSARNQDSQDIDLTLIPFVTEYDGPLTNLPGRRDVDASNIYDALRRSLPEVQRMQCDACFKYLFWCEGDALQSAVGAGETIQGLWSALSPESIAPLVDLIDALPWAALDEVALASPWQSRYLPKLEDFEHQVNNHRAFLEFALKRQAGVVSLVSA